MTRKRCLALAERLGCTIEVYKTEVTVHLPAGRQVPGCPGLDTLCTEADDLAGAWQGAYDDLRSIEKDGTEPLEEGWHTHPHRMENETMQYRVEAETMEGEQIVSFAPSLNAAKARAKKLSREHITAYVVALDHNGTAIGHIAYGEGLLGERAGCYAQ